MYGAGFILFYYPILSMVNEYWIARRGFAYGLLCSASGVSGAAMPFAVEKLLQNYGYPTTLRAVAIGLFVITGPLIPLLKPRLPETGASAPARTDWSFLRSSLFWTYSLSNFAMGMGYFFPSLYIPSYALASGLSSTQGALLLALMAVSQVVGQTSFGYLSDRRVSINVLAGASSVVAAVAVYTCWGLAQSFGILIAFSLIYGFFGAGYTALWVRFTTEYSHCTVYKAY
jgi:predicted MFS family arabinose efflux permease